MPLRKTRSLWKSRSRETRPRLTHTDSPLTVCRVAMQRIYQDAMQRMYQVVMQIMYQVAMQGMYQDAMHRMY